MLAQSSSISDWRGYKTASESLSKAETRSLMCESITLTDACTSEKQAFESARAEFQSAEYACDDACISAGETGCDMLQPCILKRNAISVRARKSDALGTCMSNQNLSGGITQ